MRPIYLVSQTPYPGVQHLPVLTIRFLNPVIDFSHYQGIILTSKQGVLALRQYPLDWKNFTYVCVSEATANMAMASGAKEVMSADGYGKTIPEVLKTASNGIKWIYLRPVTIASDWVEDARMEGVEIDEAIVYETICNEKVPKISIEENSVLIFTSPSAVSCFQNSYSLLSTHTIVAIGETTRKALLGVENVYVSPHTSVASTVELAEKIAQKGSAF